MDLRESQGHPPDDILYLSQADVSAVAPGPEELVDLVEAAFIAVGRGDVAMPPGPGLEPRPGAFLHPMIAYAEETDRICLKWLAGYSDNKRRGLPSLSALIVLNDAATGLPMAIMDGGWITAYRTAAASAVAIRALRGTAADSLSILGCGVQAHSHARLLPVVMPELRRISIHHPSIERAQEFARAIESDLPGIEVHATRDLEEAMSSSRVLISAGPTQPTPKPVVDPAWLPADVLFLALDFEAFVGPAVAAAMNRVVTDDVTKLRNFREQGFFASGLAEPSSLPALMSQRHPLTESVGGRTLFLSLGLAAEDLVVACSVFDRARAEGRGISLPR